MRFGGVEVAQLTHEVEDFFLVRGRDGLGRECAQRFFVRLGTGGKPSATPPQSSIESAVPFANAASPNAFTTCGQYVR